jgi:hypothetical protein
MSNKKNNAARTFAATVAPNLVPQAKAIAADTSLGTLTVADLTSIIAGVIAQSQTKAPKASKPAASVAVPAPVVTKPAMVAPVTSADFETNGKVQECFKAGRANSQQVAPWNGVKGQGSVGGRYSPEGIAAFKAGYNAKAAELGVPARY